MLITRQTTAKAASSMANIARFLLLASLFLRPRQASGFLQPLLGKSASSPATWSPSCRHTFPFPQRSFQTNPLPTQVQGKFHISTILEASRSDDDPFPPTGTTKDDEQDESFLFLLGNRGEAFLVAQGFLMASILLGRIPFVDKDILGSGVPLLEGALSTTMVLGGAGLFVFGLYVMYLSARELGGSLSHWAVPVPKSEGGQGLVNSGVYGVVRHPMYIGLLTTFAGLGVATDSALRLWLTVVLFIVLELKATHEEKKLQEAFPEYEEYKKEVPGKILPISLL